MAINILKRRLAKCFLNVKQSLFVAYCMCLYDSGIWHQFSPTIYRVRQKNNNPLAKRRYFDNRWAFLQKKKILRIEEELVHVSTKFHYKILMRSKVMNFLRKKSKFQIKHA